MVSIVTITFNDYEGLIKTVESLRGVENIEHIVVNGGQCEKTRSFLENYLQKSISENDSGISDAFNKGVRLFTGDSILFLNSSDTLLDSKYLSEAEKILGRESETSFVYADYIFGDGLCGDMRMGPSESTLGRGTPYNHQTMVVHRKVFEDVGGFRLDYTFSMDFEWMCRVLKAGHKGHYWKNTPVVRMDGTGITSTREHLAMREAFHALKNHHLLNLENIYGFSIRTCFYLIRKGMEKVGMIGLLRYMKKKKYFILYRQDY